MGQATCTKELLEEIPQLDYLICPVGGGGLLSGAIISAKYYGKSPMVFAAEPQGADDAYRSVKGGKLVTNITTNTIADGLLTPLGEINFEIIRNGIKEIFLVSDEEIKIAMKTIWERMKIIIEPSCAVPFAAILKNKEVFKGKKIGVILSGGNVDLTQIATLF